MLWQTYESASYAYFTNAGTKERILTIFVFTRENWRRPYRDNDVGLPPNDDVESSSSSDEENIDFILLGLAYRNKVALKRDFPWNLLLLTVNIHLWSSVVKEMFGQRARFSLYNLVLSAAQISPSWKRIHLSLLLYLNPVCCQLCTLETRPRKRVLCHGKVPNET